MKMKKTQGWHPEDIKAAIRKRNITLSSFAKELGVTAAAVSIAIHGRSSANIEREIASALGVEPNEIWPSRYGDDGRRILYRATNSSAQVAA